jgi:four helix bundle protein
MKPAHHDLKAWREGLGLVKSVYSATARFPRAEQFCLTSQMRRAAISVPSNIAEGSARASTKELLKFLVIARGSLMELETQIWVAKEQEYLDEGSESELRQRVERVFALLSGLIAAKRRSLPR